MSATIYDADYFLNKFRAIPEEKWIRGTYGAGGPDEPHCALGHCGMRRKNDGSFDSSEAIALRDIFRGHFPVHEVNDGFIPHLFPQDSPKERILAALQFIKEKGTV